MRSFETNTKKDDEKYAAALKVSDIMAFRDRIVVGDIIKHKKRRAIILQKFPYFAITDVGDITWVDLYFMNAGLFPGEGGGYIYRDDQGKEVPWTGAMHG